MTALYRFLLVYIHTHALPENGNIGSIIGIIFAWLNKERDSEEDGREKSVWTSWGNLSRIRYVWEHSSYNFVAACQKTCIGEEELPVGGSLGYPAVNHRSSATRGREKTRASPKLSRTRPRRNESVRGRSHRGGDSRTLSSWAQSSQRRDRSWNSDWRTVFRAGVSALGVLVAPVITRTRN